MPLAHQIILGIIVAGFIIYPIGLFYGWVVTRGWEYGPDGVMPPVQRPAQDEASRPSADPEYREAA